MQQSPNLALIGATDFRNKLNTPALGVDLDAMEANIKAMAAVAKKHGVALRPHAKAHKSLHAAKMQLAGGAVGLCCATLGEAEVMAAGGIQDILVTACGRAPRLLRNDQKLGHHWIRFRLEGTKSNRDAIGAWITLTLPGGQELSQQVMPTKSYLSQVELPVTFGLGEATEISKAEIRWPDGSKQTLGSLKADQVHRMVQPSE